MIENILIITGIIIYGFIGEAMYKIVNAQNKERNLGIYPWLIITGSVLWPITIFGTALTVTFKKK